MQLDDLNKQRAKAGQKAVTSPKAPTPQKATAAPAPTPAPAVMPHKDPAHELPGSGNPVYKSEPELRAAQEAGVITPEQYTAASASLQKYGTAVDPLGFGNPKPENDVNEFGDPNIRNDSTNDPLPNADQQKPQPSQPAQGVQPLTGTDLTAAADKRRNQRLAEKGIPEADFKIINDVLKQGGRLAGTENGQAVFLMPDGSKLYSPINESATKSAVEIAGTDHAAEVTDEQKAQADALRSQQTRQNMANQENRQQTQKGEKGSSGTTTSTATTDIDTTIASLTTMSQNAMGISQEVHNAYLPGILNSLNRIKELRSQAETMDSQAEQGAMVDSDPNVVAATDLANRREKQFDARLADEKRILEENKNIALEANRLATESLELDKKIVEARRREDETRKMAENVEGEKQLRRSLNAAGIETSPLAQDYLQKKITEAADSLATMRQTNDLTLLKFDGARKELANGVRSILSDFDSKRTTLYANYDDNIFNLDQFVSGSRSAAFKDVQEKLKALTDKEDDLYKSAGDQIRDMSIKAIDMQRQAKLDSQAEKDKAKTNAYQLFNFAFGSSTDPALRRAAVTAMQDAGYALPGNIDMSSLPISMQLANLQKAKDSEQSDFTNPFRFKDGASQTIMSQAYNAVGSLPVAIQGPRLRYIASLLDAGEVGKARKEIEGVAVSSLTGKQSDAYADRSTIIASTDSIDKQLKAIDADTRGFYKYKWENFQKFLNNSQEPSYLNLSAQIENIAGIMIKDRYGANVTGPEWERAQTYIPTSRDTVLDAMGKLRQLKTFLETKNSETINAKLGDIGGDASMLSPNSQYDDDWMKGDSGGVVLPTGPQGMRTDRHNNPTAFTTDIARQAGLREGVDYEYDAQLANGFPTAKLLGDPVATTIQVIDKIGFYTDKGSQRWTHTAMPKSQWDAMGYPEKVKVIEKMYSREGGSQLAGLFNTRS